MRQYIASILFLVGSIGCTELPKPALGDLVRIIKAPYQYCTGVLMLDPQGKLQVDRIVCHHYEVTDSLIYTPYNDLSDLEKL